MKKVVLLGLALLLICPAALAEETAARAGIDLTAVINAFLALIGALITRRLVPYLREKMTDAQYRRALAAVNVAVYAAEEIYKSGHGAEKLEYAQKYLSGKGYAVDLDEIKAAVKKMRIAEENGARSWGREGPETHERA